MKNGKEEERDMAKNPYTVLGVSENATDEEIRAAYRRLAKQYHPDLNPNDPVAAARMNDVNVAYDQIKTADKRAAYRAQESSQTFYQQSGYNSNPWQTYYKTGQGYYGGSYTGYDKSDSNEPPFGWGSIFEEQQRRRTHTTQYRRIRLIYLVLTFLMILFLAQCVLTNTIRTCSSLFWACSDPGTYYGNRSQTNEIDNSYLTGVDNELS